MSIATVVTRGFGSFGSIPFVVTRGYGSYGAPATFDIVLLTNDAYVSPSLFGSSFASPSLLSESSVLPAIIGEAWEGQ